MDYEKLYKDALERARKLYNEAKTLDYAQDMEDYETIFPELKELRDEIIRKKLVDLLYKVYANTNYITCAEHDDFNYWLEKQAPKPQRIISAEAKEALYDKPKWTEEDEENFRDIISAIHSVAYQTTEDEEARIDWLKSIKKRMEE